MKIEKYSRPFTYFGLTLGVSWILWFIMAGISHSDLWDIQIWKIFGSILGLLGLSAPMVVAFALILPDRDMRNELKNATFSFKGFNKSWFAFIILFPFVMLFLSQTVSLLFGHNTDQFKLAGEFSFSAGIFPVWLLFLIVPLLEEFGWRTYGTHCIRRKINVFYTSLIFGVIWAIWHIPLSFVNGYYHSNVAETGLLYSINYSVSLIPYLIFDSWVYYKTKRNMLIQFIMHLVFNFSMEMFRTHEDSKVIYTGLFIIFCTIIILKDKKFFFDKTFVDGEE